MPIIPSIPSKSVAHRMLIGAFLAGDLSLVQNPGTSKDVLATLACLRGGELLPCGESGSTLRFLLPVMGALGRTCTFLARGRLPRRPLDQSLPAHGMHFGWDGDRLPVSGQLQPGDYEIPGNVSSQFLTGLLLALPLLEGESTVTVTGPLESRPYVDLTLACLREFGIFIPEEHGVFTVKPQKYRRTAPIFVEGDWSNAAFWLCAGAFWQPVTVTGLNLQSVQGDRAILEILQRFGARVEGCTVSPGDLRGLDIDCRAIPDLVPILAVTAAFARGDTRFLHAERLRLKESDRIQSVCALINSLGGQAEETADGLLVRGQPLTGGTVDPFGDHRIAMAASMAGLRCPVEILDRACTDKSYPGFWEVRSNLTLQTEGECV